MIEGLLSKGHSVDVLSHGRALKILQEKFGSRCNYFDVPSFFIPKNSRYFFLGCTINLHRIIAVVMKARKFSKKILNEGNYDLIISDNRFDLYDKPHNSIMIVHTLNFESSWFKYPVNGVFDLLLRPYNTLIVPDFPRRILTNGLSLNRYHHKKVNYVGILSQVEKKNFKQDIEYFISLSGPEPARTILEEKILFQYKFLKGKVVIAAANPDVKRNKTLGKNVRYYSFLNSQYQEEMMNRAKVVITRAGFSTLSNLIELGKTKAILIPHPGQPEQEYLANFYEGKKAFHKVAQQFLDLEKDVKDLKKYRGMKIPWKTKTSVKKFLKVIERFK